MPKSFNNDAPLAKFKPPVVDVESAVRCSVGSLASVTPRFVARTRALDVNRVIKCFERLARARVVDRLYGKGEPYYCKGPKFEQTEQRKENV